MARQVFRSRAESPIIRPFESFDRLEELVAAIELSVSTRHASRRLVGGSSFKCSADELGRVGITVDLNCEPSDLESALAEGNMSPSDASFVILATEPRGGHLRQQDILWHGAISELRSELQVVARGGDRERALQNTHNGFDLSLAVVIARPLERRRLMPSREGTILAEVRFRVRPFGHTSGMQPRPLTSEVRAEFDLRPDTWLWVRRNYSLHDSPSLSDAVTVYVDDEILGLAARQTSSSKAVVESLFVVPALTQLVYLLSQDLVAAGDQWVWEGDGSEALSLLFDTLRECSVEMAPDVLVSTLRNDPQRVAAIVTGYDKQKRRIIDFLNADLSEEQNDDVSSD